MHELNWVHFILHTLIVVDARILRRLEAQVVDVFVVRVKEVCLAMP